MRRFALAAAAMDNSPLRLRLDGAALAANWQALDRLSGSAACGAAVKADGYGLGADAVVTRLTAAGARDFFVATWAEAAALADRAPALSVLHGVRDDDMTTARALAPVARPVLNTPVQVQRWRDAGGGRCDVMVDTGMNRLGLTAQEAMSGLLDGIEIDTLMSHLASADEDVALTARQRARFAEVAARVPAKRNSLANSAGIFLGRNYAFDLTRPGLALYGGIPREQANGVIAQVAVPEAQVLQRRRALAGDTVGYNSTFTAPSDMDLLVLNIGYADGYGRGFSNIGSVRAGDATLPVVGRVSMDLLIVDATGCDAGEGDWLAIDFALPEAATASGRSQYELLTGLGSRFDRVWR